MKYILGVDPGLSGALAWYDPTDRSVIVHDMPTFQIDRNKGHRREIDYYNLGRLIDTYAADTKSAFVERVASMPAQGIASAFTFGEAFGAVKGAIAANLIPMQLITPQVWKRSFGLTQDKDASRRAASQLLPAHGAQWQRSKDDGRAEAVLLAIFGSKFT